MRLFRGDVISALTRIELHSVDALITDPPAGISFMGKSWDDDKGGRKQWIEWMTSVMAECLRVMKPGAHGLVWAIPRTSHWTATALEDAGFEIRDVVTHLFGSGFPKSLDVSKAMDKSVGAEREVIGKKKMLSHVERGDSNIEDQGYYNPQNSAFTSRGDALITRPSTDLAKQWQGWGTALKPAVEEWILIRKPLSEKTVAKNVERWGCGGINIDASRIEGKPEKLWGRQYCAPGNGITYGKRKRIPYVPATAGRIPYVPAAPGRFPANLILSHSDHCTDTQCDIECAIKMLDEQSGNCGGASRFFYCAKVSKRDKGTDNIHPTVKSTKLMEYLIRMITPHNGTILDPFMGSGSTGVAAKRIGFKFIGIEKEKEYFEIAKQRIRNA